MRVRTILTERRGGTREGEEGYQWNLGCSWDQQHRGEWEFWWPCRPSGPWRPGWHSLLAQVHFRRNCLMAFPDLYTIKVHVGEQKERGGREVETDAGERGRRIPNPALAAATVLWVAPQSDITHPYWYINKSPSRDDTRGDTRGDSGEVMREVIKWRDMIPGSPCQSWDQRGSEGSRRHRCHWFCCMSTSPRRPLRQQLPGTEDLHILD